MAYRRSVDGAKELVIAGAWHRSDVSAGLSGLDEKLDSTECNTPPVAAKRLVSQSPETVAFSSVWVDQNDRRVSIARSYTFLEGDPGFEGTLVMVSIQRTGEGDPSPGELERLTQAQLTKSQAHSS